MYRKKAFQIISDAVAISKTNKTLLVSHLLGAQSVLKEPSDESSLDQVPELIRLYLSSKLRKLDTTEKRDLVSHIHYTFTIEIDQTFTSWSSTTESQASSNAVNSRLRSTLEQTLYIIEQNYSKWICPNLLLSRSRHFEVLGKLEPRYKAIIQRFAFHSSHKTCCHNLNDILFQPFFTDIDERITHRYYQIVVSAIEEFERRLTGVSASRAVTSEIFIEVLVAIEFNHPEFLTFLNDRLKANLRRCQSWKAKSKLLVDYQKRVKSIYTLTKCSYLPDMVNVKKQISLLLASEAESLTFDEQYQTSIILETENQKANMELGISNEAFAALLNVMLESGIFKANNRKELAKHIARTFTSDKGKPIGEMAFYQNLMAPEVATLEKVQHLVERKLPLKISEIIEKRVR